MMEYKTIENLFMQEPYQYQELIDVGFKLVKWDEVIESNQTQVSTWGNPKDGHLYTFRRFPDEKNDYNIKFLGALLEGYKPGIKQKNTENIYTTYKPKPI